MRGAAGPPAAPPRWLDGRWPPGVAGVLAALAVFIVWGSFSPVPVIQDEWAYWLQADQYAHLHWSVPAPPLPEFFEQFYVLVTPVFASKYWPGSPLVLAPGFLLGVPALMPLLLTAITGALVFTLARRVAGGGAALLTWALWLGTFGNLRFRASYFSETTTSLCWLAAWWALLEWRATRRTGWLVALAAATAWGAITRPATMLLFALPLGLLVLRDVRRERRWPDLAVGLLVGSLVLAIVPLWSARVTGDARITPIALFTRQYIPFDYPGFTLSKTPPQRALPGENERTRTFLREQKQEQVETPIWRTATARMRVLLGDAFGGWRLPFAAAFAAGLIVLGSVGWFALGTSLLLFAGYLAQAHTVDWTLYYLETMPVLAFTAAIGTMRAYARLRGNATPRWLPFALTVVGAALLLQDVLGARDILGRVAARPRAFTAAVALLPKRPNIVFVRYASRRSMHIPLVANRGELERSASWIVHDRGDDNARLLDAAPGRAAYLFDEASGAFREVRR